MAEIISLGDLIQILSNIISNIRNSESGTYQELQDNVDKLQEIHFKRSNKSNNVLDMFNAYEQIITISIQLRKLLTAYDIQLAQYNQLDYALYFRGERYYASTANIAAAVSYGGIRITKAGLMIDLKKITESLQEDIRNDCRQSLFDAFSEHYKSFLSYASGMYQQQNKSQFGVPPAKVNLGHVAEAHERHLQEHHSTLFRLSTQKDLTPTDLLTARLEEFKQQTTEAHWHEGPEGVWGHIRASLGYQRGTVAGDVNATQVKQVKEGSASSTLRLSSITNLKLGIKMYSAIFNPDIPVQQVASGIAIYISDILDNDARTSLNRYILPKILKDDFNINHFLDQYSNIQINI